VEEIVEDVTQETSQDDCTIEHPKRKHPEVNEQKVDINKRFKSTLDSSEENISAGIKSSNGTNEEKINTSNGSKKENSATETKSSIDDIATDEPQRRKQGTKWVSKEENGEPETARKRKRIMFAILLSYSGKGYYGLQINLGFNTIEGELMQAMLKAELVNEEDTRKLQLLHFQRAARTDKGVSAVRQVVNCKLPIKPEEEESKYIELINTFLPDRIRVMDIRRVVRSFNSKNFCEARTYSYLMPTFAFASLEDTSESYRLPQEGLTSVRELFSQYLGTKNFHNFTIKKKATEANAKRFILSITCEDPFERDGLEWVHIKIKGQSFMMHQIRKMIGLVISISRGIASPATMISALSHSKVDTPRAPGLGLVLEQPHYPKYNQKYDNGFHKPLLWDEEEIVTKIEAFRREYIDKDIIDTEKQEKSMHEYLMVLHKFAFNQNNGELQERAELSDAASDEELLRQKRLILGEDGEGDNAQAFRREAGKIEKKSDEIESKSDKVESNSDKVESKSDKIESKEEVKEGAVV